MTSPRHLGPVLLAVLLVTPAVGLAACGDSAPAGCACAATQYCCLGACQALGTVCGRGDGGAGGDGQVVPPDGGGFDAASDAGGPVCAAPCNEGYECAEWTDPSTGATHTDCLPPGSVACDPMTDTAHCDGAAIVSCRVNGFFPEVGPPGFEDRYECTSLYGPTASCEVAAGTASCTGAACDPATFAGRCDTASDDVILSCDARHFVRHDTCLPEWRCLVNEWTVADAGGATCIPRIAVPTGGTATSARMALACDGADAIHVEQYGYEWSERCRSGEACFTFPASVGGAPARCLPASTRTCDPATFDSSCDAPATSEQQCVLGVVTPRYCGVALVSGSIPSACDDATGACVPTDFCPPTGYTPRCTADGRFRITCNMAWAREIAERCPCTTDAGGMAVCG